MFFKIVFIATLAAVQSAPQHGHYQQATSYASLSQGSGGHSGNIGLESSGYGSSGLSAGLGASESSSGSSSGHHQAQSYATLSFAPVAVHAAPVAVHAAPAAIHSAPVAVHSAPVAVNHVPIASSGHHYEEKYPDAHPQYSFKYGVEDKHTGDIKSHQETRDGDVTKGEYSLHEPDGTVLRVVYHVDKKSGFNAVVHREGHAKHAAPQPKHHY